MDAELVDVNGLPGKEDHSFEQLYDMVERDGPGLKDKEKPW